MYDFAANVNDFLSNFLTILRLNVTKSRLIINKFAANLYDFAANQKLLNSHDISSRENVNY